MENRNGTNLGRVFFLRYVDASRLKQRSHQERCDEAPYGSTRRWGEEDVKGQRKEGQRNGRDSKRREGGKGRKWEKWCEAKENCQKPRFLPNVYLLGAPVPTTLDQSAPNLACLSRFTVCTYPPNFIPFGVFLRPMKSEKPHFYSNSDDQQFQKYGWCPPKFKWFTWPNHAPFRDGLPSMG